MKFSINIDCLNDGLILDDHHANPRALAFILRDLANRLEDYSAGGDELWTIRDVNGNNVGTLELVKS